MIPRALALATLLMTAATLLSEPAVAAELRVPETTPPDLAAPAAGSAAPLDFEQLVSSYASVTHVSDGTTTVTPASAVLRALLELEYEGDRI